MDRPDKSEFYLIRRHGLWVCAALTAACGIMWGFLLALIVIVTQ